MRRPGLMIAALVLVAACAAEDPVAQTAAPAPTATQTTAPTPATTEAAAPDEADHEEDHEDEEAHEDEHGEEANHEEAEDHDDDDAAADGRMIQVTMTEFAFEPSTIEISAGEPVTFMIENAGLIEHEFRLSNAHRIEEHIAAGHADHGEEGEGHHDAGGDVIVLVAAGESEHLTFVFPEDVTLYTHVACLLPGHYEAGMVSDLTTTG